MHSQIMSWCANWRCAPKAATALQILDRHRFEQCRFAGAGFSDDIHMREAIFVPDAEEPLIFAIIDAREVCDAARGHTVHPSSRMKCTTLGGRWCRKCTSPSVQIDHEENIEKDFENANEESIFVISKTRFLRWTVFTERRTLY
jgi:hypothetical protein